MTPDEQEPHALVRVRVENYYGQAAEHVAVCACGWESREERWPGNAVAQHEQHQAERATGKGD